MQIHDIAHCYQFTKWLGCPAAVSHSIQISPGIFHSTNSYQARLNDRHRAHTCQELEIIPKSPSLQTTG